MIRSDGAQANPTAPVAEVSRVALWDNARFALIALVVIGHALVSARNDSALGSGLYVAIYLFHMPALIALSGLFAKRELTPKLARSTIQLLVTWLMWEGIWAVIRFLARGSAPSDRWLVVPAWTLWFLVTLATMRILLPYIARFRYPLTLSIVLALAAGLTPAIGTEFSAQRTLCLLPFFVGAWLAKERGWFARARFLAPGRGARAAAAAFLFIIAVVLVAFPGLREFWRLEQWITWRDSAVAVVGESGIGDWSPDAWWQLVLAGTGIRVVLLAVAAAMTLALIIVIPRRSGFITVWGTRTLYVYLLHAPIIWALRETGLGHAIGGLGDVGVLILIVGGAVLAAALSARWVSRLFRPVIEPRLDWLFARDPAR